MGSRLLAPGTGDQAPETMVPDSRSPETCSPNPEVPSPGNSLKIFEVGSALIISGII